MTDTFEVLRFVFVAIGLVLFAIGLRCYWRWKKTKELDQIRETRQRKRQSNIKYVTDSLISKREIPPERHQYVLSLGAKELTSQIKSRKLKATEVLQVYQTKALEIHQRTNCLIEFYIEAEKLAENIDKASHREGLLFGIPVSLKEDIAVKGSETTLGSTKMIGDIYTKDSLLVETLKKQGAIPFVKTNIAHMLMAYECSNPIFGATCNPVCLSRTPGGSSGGEAALIAGGGSLLGFGSDVAGSVRNPAAFTGVCGFKSTPERISKKGMMRDSIDYADVTNIWGPLGHDMESLILGIKALWDGQMNEGDDGMVPLAFKEKIFEDKGPLRIGFIHDFGNTRAIPAMIRGVDVARRILENKGHTLVPWKVPDVESIVWPQYAMFSLDGGKGLADLFDCDRVDPCIKVFGDLVETPIWMRTVKAAMYQQSNPEFSKLNRYSCGMDLSQFLNLTVEINNFRQTFYDAMNKEKLDAFIMPPFPIVAPPINQMPLIMEGTEYQLIANVLGSPAGVVKVTTVNEQDQENLEQNYPVTDLIHKRIKESMNQSSGLPVAVQIGTKKWQDELCLRVMKEIEDGVKGQDHGMTG